MSHLGPQETVEIPTKNSQRSSSRAKKPVERFQPSATTSRAQTQPQQSIPVVNEAFDKSSASAASGENFSNATPRTTPKSSANARSKSNNSQAETKKAKKRNQRRVTKARVTADLLRNLPDGVTHVPESDETNSQKKQKEQSAQDKNIDIVRVGEFQFDIGIVSKTSLIAMRKYLPSEEYRLLKNRKSARLCRLKRKQERGSMKSTLTEVETELNDLRDDLEAAQKKL